jgi:cell wall assembly regulator SMI1
MSQNNFNSKKLQPPEIETAIRGIWGDIEQWYLDREPEKLNSLLEGATDEQIAEFETKVGVQLPVDYKASLKIHNGYVNFHSYTYTNLEATHPRWLMMTDAAERGLFEFEKDKIINSGGGIIQNTWWHRNWIPFAADINGNYFCLDMAPAVNGEAGQIIFHSYLRGPVITKYQSFMEWVEACRDNLYRDIRVLIGETNSLSDISAAFLEVVGTTAKTLKFQKERPDSPEPDELDILLVYETEDVYERENVEFADFEFAAVTTSGMSTRALPGPHPYIELGLSVHGEFAIEEVEALGQKIAELAMMAFREEIHFAPGVLLRDVSLPMFDGMNCVLIADWYIHTPEWLRDLPNPPLLLTLLPLYESEVDIIEQIGVVGIHKLFLKQKIEWPQRDRPPLKFSLLEFNLVKFKKQLIKDLSLRDFDRHPDAAERALLPPQDREINQTEEPEQTSIPATSPSLASTSIAENISRYQLDREIVLAHYGSECDFWVNTLVFVYQNDRVVDCHLILKADKELYLYIEEEEIFNLTPDFSTPLFGTDLLDENECIEEEEILKPTPDFSTTLFGTELLDENDIELEIRLSPDLLPHLLRHAQTVDEAAAYILKLSGEQPQHPLIASQNWFCMEVKQSFELESGQTFESVSKSYSTFWYYLSLSDLTMAKSNEEQFSQRLLDEYTWWIEEGNGRIQDANEEVIDRVTEFFQIVAMNIRSAVTNFENLDGEIYQAVLKFFTDQGLPIDPPQGHDFFWLDVQTSNGKWRARAEMSEKEQKFLFYSRYFYRVPKNKIIEIAELLTRANNYLSLGNFELDWVLGDIRYRTSICLPGIWSSENPLNQELLKHLVYRNLATADKYLPAIKAVLEEDLSPEEALALINTSDSF